MVDDWMMLMNGALLSFCHNEIMNVIVLEAISPFEMGKHICGYDFFFLPTDTLSITDCHKPL